jgi:hypothetical protein
MVGTVVAVWAFNLLFPPKRPVQKGGAVANGQIDKKAEVVKADGSVRRRVKGATQEESVADESSKKKASSEYSPSSFRIAALHRVYYSGLHYCAILKTTTSCLLYVLKYKLASSILPTYLVRLIGVSEGVTTPRCDDIS